MIIQDIDKGRPFDWTEKVDQAPEQRNEKLI